jgi:hypothetical protein
MKTVTEQQAPHASLEDVRRLIAIYKEQFGDAAETAFSNTVRITFPIQPSPSALESLWSSAR